MTHAARGRLPADLGARVAVAVPAAAVLVAAVHLGGLALALPLALLGFLAQRELAALAGVRGTPALPGALAVALAPLCVLGLEGSALAGAAALGAAFATGAAAALAGAGRRRRAALASACGLAWIGVTLGHGVALRELDHGAALVIAVLLATFLGDTAAQLVGTAFGRRKLAPAISPNKTVEGLAAGILGGTAAGAAFLVLFHGDWIDAGAAVALGLAAALAAPAGDLFESALKRRAGVKDSGRLFGAHGGALDRMDAALAAVTAGFYVALAVA